MSPHEREAMALHLWDEGLVRPEPLAFAVVDAFISAGWKRSEPETGANGLFVVHWDAPGSGGPFRSGVIHGIDSAREYVEAMGNSGWTKVWIEAAAWVPVEEADVAR